MSATSSGQWLVEATPEAFEQQVIQRSHQVPILLEFWSATCPPCRQLMPILKQLADEYQGRFELVTADTEMLPEAAAAFGVQSIPAVYLLREGRIADQFIGLVPREQIMTWLDSLLPSEAERLIVEARTQEADQPQAAEKHYRQALELDPHLDAAKIGLARVLLSQDRADESREMIDDLKRRGFLESEAEDIEAELVLREQGEQVGSVESCQQAVSESPDDLNLQLELAQALVAAGQHEAALQQALAIVERDKKGVGEPARELMVNLFHVLGVRSELATTYRKKLSAALY